MGNKFDDILSGRIKELPLHSPSESLWRGIEAALETEEAISRKLQDLPIYSPSPCTWEAIRAAVAKGGLTGSSVTDLTYTPESTLDVPSGSNDITEFGKQSAMLYRRIFYMAISGVAAIALLLLMIPRLVQTGQRITVESETVLSEEINTPLIPASEDEDPIEVIKDLCKTGAPVCQSELFLEKMQLYMELSEELRLLETVIGELGESPEMIKSVIRIENLKSGTLQELIQLIHS